MPFSCNRPNSVRPVSVEPSTPGVWCHRTECTTLQQTAIRQRNLLHEPLYVKCWATEECWTIHCLAPHVGIVSIRTCRPSWVSLSPKCQPTSPAFQSLFTQLQYRQVTFRQPASSAVFESARGTAGRRSIDFIYIPHYRSFKTTRGLDSRVKVGA